MQPRASDLHALQPLCTSDAVLFELQLERNLLLAAMGPTPGTASRDVPGTTSWQLLSSRLNSFLISLKSNKRGLCTSRAAQERLVDEITCDYGPCWRRVMRLGGGWRSRGSCLDAGQAYLGDARTAFNRVKVDQLVSHEGTGTGCAA